MTQTKRQRDELKALRDRVRRLEKDVRFLRDQVIYLSNTRPPTYPMPQYRFKPLPRVVTRYRRA